MSSPTSTPDPRLVRLHSIARALRKQRSRLARKVEAIRGDLAESARAPEYRRQAEALLAYLHLVPKRATTVRLADPHDAERTLDIALDPALNAQGNASRYFKRAAKGERGAVEIRARLEAAEGEVAALSDLIERAKAIEHSGKPLHPTQAVDTAGSSAVDASISSAGDIADTDTSDAPATDAPSSDPDTFRDLSRDLEIAARKLPIALRTELAAATPAPAKPRDETGEVIHRPAPPKPKRAEELGKLQPRRLRTTEDNWDVLIGRSNEGNDHLTLHMARPEDYWFHVHGTPGSHVVLRRGRGKNEPSKRTLEEVAGWTAFYSQARTAGKVSVIWTLKKYVRKPRGAKPGTVSCEREKSIMARPKEPDRTNLADQAEQENEP